MKNQLYGTNVILYLVSFLISATLSLMVWLTAYEAMTKLGPETAREYFVQGLTDLAIYVLIFSGAKEKPPYIRTLWISSLAAIYWGYLYMNHLEWDGALARLGVAFFVLCKLAMIGTLWMLRRIDRIGATTPPW